MSFLLLRLGPNRDSSALMAYLATNKYSFVVGLELFELAPWAAAVVAREAKPTTPSNLGNVNGKTGFPYDPPGEGTANPAFPQVVKMEPPDAFVQQNMNIHVDTTNFEPISDANVNGATPQPANEVSTAPDVTEKVTKQPTALSFGDPASQETFSGTQGGNDVAVGEGGVEDIVQEQNVERGLPKKEVEEEEETIVGGVPEGEGGVNGTPTCEGFPDEEAMEVEFAPADVVQNMDSENFDEDEQSNAMEEESESDDDDEEYKPTNKQSSKTPSVRYNCSVAECNVDFPVAADLITHMADSHPHQQAFRCVDCPRQFLHKPSLQRHREKYHSAPLSFKCLDCGRAFDAWQVLHEHHQIFANRPHLFCEPCNLTVTLSEFLVHEQSLYHRFATGEQKPENVALKQQMDNGNPEEQMEQPIDTSCDDRIDETAPDARMDDDDATIDSQDLSATPFSSTSHPWTCPVKECGAEFTFQKHLLSHVDSRHPGTLPFGCSRCSQQFAYSTQMYKHMRLEHGEEWTEHPDGYTCEKCGRVFSQASNYRAHRVAYEHRPHFYCGPCHMTIDQDEYDRHQEKHQRKAGKEEKKEVEFDVDMEPEEEKPPQLVTPTPRRPAASRRSTRLWKCPIPYCGSPAFLLQKTMIAHVFEDHPGQKPFWCLRCPRQFNQKGLLDRHMATWHGVPMPRCEYKCFDCGKVYHRQIHLQRHVESFRGAEHVCCDMCDVVVETEVLERHRKTHCDDEQEPRPVEVTEPPLDQSMDVGEDFDYVIDAVYDYEWDEDELLDDEEKEELDQSTIGGGIRPLGEVHEEVGPIQQPDEFPYIFTPPETPAPNDDGEQFCEKAQEEILKKHEEVKPEVEKLPVKDVAETEDREIKTEETVGDHEYGGEFPAGEQLFRGPKEPKEEEEEEHGVLGYECVRRCPLTPPCSEASDWEDDADQHLTTASSSDPDDSTLDVSMSEEKLRSPTSGLHPCYLRWKCPIRNCGAAFRWERLLVDHMAEHPGQKPFHCSLCPRKFSSNGHLLRHKRKNHYEDE